MNTAEGNRRQNKRNHQNLTSSSGVREIKCPFFKQHNEREIRCEGIMDDCSHAIVFKGRGKKAYFQHTYCEDQYRACEYYRMLMHEKYPDE